MVVLVMVVVVIVVKCRHGGPTTSAGLESTLRNKAARFYLFIYLFILFSVVCGVRGVRRVCGVRGPPFRNLSDIPEVVPELKVGTDLSHFANKPINPYTNPQKTNVK